MPSVSPSSVKRPSMAERSSSTHSLSSSGKLNPQPKVHRVTRHSRNVSHGKNLSKLGRVQSSHNMAGENKPHQRKKSGPVTPGHSPKTPVSPHIKRNSSHVQLTKNTSFGNLRKNQSAKELAAIAKNLSQGNLKKLGAPPSQRSKEEDKSGVFDLGDRSSDEEDEEEWEDSATQSPELSRNVSKTSTPLRPRTPNGDHLHKASDNLPAADRMTSPPEAELKRNNRQSAPNLRKAEILSSDQRPADPALLANAPRAARAPPAMSTVSAQVRRSDSTRSITKITNRDMESSGTLVSSAAAGTSSSSHGVSHFLPSTSGDTVQQSIRDDSDDDSPNGFMSNYKPQVSDSPEKSRMLNKARISSVPSRTQQRLELQRREVMRAGGAAAASPGPAGMSLGGASSVSLHSHSGSKSRNRVLVSDPKVMKQDFEIAIKQLTVVRRFRNPTIDSLNRLQESNILSAEGSSILLSNNTTTKFQRPPSRRGLPTANGSSRSMAPNRNSLEDRRSQQASQVLPEQQSGSSSRNTGRPNRVSFQVASRNVSNDDIVGGLTTSRGSYDDDVDGEDDEALNGMTAEEALIRRIWEGGYVSVGPSQSHSQTSAT